MSPALLHVTDTETFVFGYIVRLLDTLNSGVLSLLSYQSSVIVSASASLCSTPSKSNKGVYFKVIGTRQEIMGTMLHCMGNVPSTSLSSNDVLISGCTARLSMKPSWTPTYMSHSWTKSIRLRMTLTGLLRSYMKDILWIGRMQSRHTTGNKDVLKRFNPASVLETLPVRFTVVGVIPKPIWAFSFFYLNNSITSVLSQSKFSLLFPSAAETVEAAALATSGRSSKVAFRCVHWLVTGENGIPGRFAPTFFVPLWSGCSRLL